MASFDENGKYIKTNWKAGDKITATKLNKIEESIEAVNDNDISRHVEADARLDALEAKDVAHDKELTNIKNTIADNKAAAELGDYDINSRMTFLENELNEGIEEVHNVAETVDGKIATAEANMTAQVNTAKDEMTAQVDQGKADMEAMVAEVEGELEGLRNALTDITIIIRPGDGWEDMLYDNFGSNTHVKLIGNFETNSTFEFINVSKSKLEVMGEIKVMTNDMDNRQLFIFTGCSNLELILNVDCNKNETVSNEYFPMMHCVECENITIAKSNIKNAPHTALGFTNSKNCIVKDSNFVDFHDSGLNIGEGSINCIAKNNNFSCPDGLMNYGSHALNIYSRGVGTFGHLISGNNFYDIQSTAIQLTGRINTEGVELLDVTDCIIENNIVNFYGHNGVKLDGTGKNIMINNNIFKNANVRPDGTVLEHDCYGIFTSGQAGRAYSVDVEGNFFENAGSYALRFNTDDTSETMGYVNFRNNTCINSPIYITNTSKVNTVDIVGNRISNGLVLMMNGLSGTSTINTINITHNLLDSYGESGYAMYFNNNGCLRFSNNTLICSNAGKNPPYFGYLASTNMIIENNNVINNGSSDAGIRTIAGVIDTCIFNGNGNIILYNEADIATSYIKDYIKIK